MMLQQLTVTHGDAISQLLSSYYAHLNEKLGNAFYNTSVEVMKKHVSTRL
jgi:hypothetical protein